MGLISEILNYVRGAGDADTVEGVEAALHRLAAERLAANEAIGTGADRRRGLLLQDGSDKAIAALDRELDGHRLVLERLELVEGQLFERLQMLRSDRRKVNWKKFSKKYEEVALICAKATRAAIAARMEVAAAIDDARAHGFEAEAMATFAPPPFMVGLAEVEIFEGSLDRARDVAISTAAKPVAPAPLRGQPKPATVGSPRRVALGEREAPAPKNNREPITETPGDGELQVTVMRDGYESPSGKQRAHGDRIAMTPEIARIAVINGAVEYVNSEVAA
jgi:hypothetical protein